MAFNPDKCLKFICDVAPVTISMRTSSIDSSHYKFSKDGIAWVNDTITLQPGEHAWCKGTNYPSKRDGAPCFSMSGDGFVDVDGNVMSLIDDGAGDQLVVEKTEAFWKLFALCTQLRNALNPLLFPATTLSKYCYGFVVYGCPNFDIPEDFTLPCIDLPEGCYCNMFQKCGIRKVPKSLFGYVKNYRDLAYAAMFYECERLTVIEYPHRYYMDINEGHLNWVSVLPSSGTFYCLSSVSTVYDGSHIPPGWEVKPLYEFDPEKCLKITCFTGSFQAAISPSVHYGENYWFSKDGVNWIINEIDVSKGDVVYIKGKNAPSKDTSNFRVLQVKNPSEDLTFGISGHISSLIDGVGEDLTNRPADYGFHRFFSSCGKYLVSVGEDLLNITHNTYGLYNSLFLGCTGLTELPEKLLYNCTKNGDIWANLFESMFNGCTSLEKVPKGFLKCLTNIETTELFRGLFMGCSKLNDLWVYFNNWGTTAGVGTTFLWMDGVATTGTFHCPGALPKTRGTSYIPNGWNVESFIDAKKCLKFTCSDAQVKISIPVSKVWPTHHYYFSKDCVNWVADTITLQPGESAYCYGSEYPSVNLNNFSSFTMTGSGKIKISGNLLSMVDNGLGEKSDIEREYAFCRLFYNCTQITQIDEEFFVATPGDMANYCYANLFEGCSSLQQIRVPFTTWSENATRNWVTGVAPEGNFYALEELPKVFDASHIPPAWENKPLYTVLNPFAIYANLRGKIISPKDPVLFNGNYVPINRDTGEAGPAPIPTSPSTLLPGNQISDKRNALVTSTEINKIKFSKTSIFPDSAVTVSTAESQAPVKMWFDQNDGILYFGSISDHIYANEDMNRFFMGLPNCGFADISWVDMSTAKNIEAFVYNYGTNLTESYIQGFGHMDLSSVTKISIFVWDSSLKIPKNSVFNFESMEDGTNTTLFAKMPNLTDDIFKTLKFKFPKLHTLNGTSSIQAVFLDLPITEFPAGVFEFGTNLTGGLKVIFSSLPNVKKIDVSDWPVKLPMPASGQSVECYWVFYKNPNLEEIDISGWDIYNADKVGGFLYDCAKLERVYVDETWRDNDHPSSYFVTGGTDMIYQCPSLRGQFGHTPGSPGTGIPAWMKVDKPTINGALTCKYRTGEAELLDGNEFNIALKKACNFTNPTVTTLQTTVTSIEPRETAIPGSRYHQVISSNTTGPKVYACLSPDNKTLQIISEAKKVYAHYSSIMGEEINFRLNSTADMFRGFTLAQAIDISWIDFSRIQIGGAHMFYDCHSLIDIPGFEIADFTGSGRKDMEDKRYQTYFESMFRYCHALTDSVIDRMNKMKIANITTTYVMFEECNSLFNVNIAWDFGGLTSESDCRRMFYNCAKLRNITFENAKNWIEGGDLAEMFRLCPKLAYANLSSLIYPANLWAMFAECPALYYVDFCNIKSDHLWKISVGPLSAIFWKCYNLRKFFISDDWVLPAGASTSGDTFLECNNLTSQCGYQIGGAGTGPALFRSDDPYHHGGAIGLGCYKPKHMYPANGETINLAIKAATGSKVGTGAVTDVDQKVLHFVVSDHYECAYASDVQIANESLETYTKPDGTTAHLTMPCGTFFRWDATTQTVTFFTMAEKNYAPSSLANMFRAFSAVKDIDISWLSTDNVNLYSAMFYDCTNLEQITWPQKTDVSLAEGVDINYAFTRCQKIKDIDLSFLNLTNPEATLGLTGTFKQCYALESFKLPTIATQIKKVTLGEGFYGCTSLKKIDLATVKCDTMTYENAFNGASALKTIGLPAVKMTSGTFDISGLFSGITNLASVDFSKWELSSSVKLSCKNVFSGCTNLHRIYLPKDPTKWATIADDSLEQPFATNCERLTGDNGTRYSTALNKGKYLVLDKAPASVGFGSTLHEYY